MKYYLEIVDMFSGHYCIQFKMRNTLEEVKKDFENIHFLNPIFKAYIMSFDGEDINHFCELCEG